MIPGICLCLAPGLGRDAQVRYSLGPMGFINGPGEQARTNDAIFFDGAGNPLPGGGTAQQVTQGPLGKIEFFLQGAFVGRYAGSTSSPAPITGYMANEGYTGGSANRHRRGQGRYVVTSREAARRIAQALHLDQAIPSEAGLAGNFSDFLGHLDAFRGHGSQFAAWFQNLNAVGRGTMNLAVLSYLHFPPD